MVEGLSTALANGQDVDNEAEDCVGNLWRIGKKDFLFDGFDLRL